MTKDREKSCVILNKCKGEDDQGGVTRPKYFEWIGSFIMSKDSFSMLFLS